MNISLGYEIGSGKRVSIPVNHTVVLGQTQLSGKTTTLEAMVERSGLRAVGFITKPGEKSFRLQTQIPAFFSEATIEEYWKHVVAILEYRAGTRLGWRERGVVIKLCQDYRKETSRIGIDKKSGKTKREAVKYSWRAPHTLRELLGNIEAWMPFTRGQEEMICIQLREYLRPAIHEIERTNFSDKLKLAPGINVMDVTDLSDGLKSLVIRSVIEWVHKHGRKIVVIIPEAWKFIPEGRSTPVKLALEALIREGAGVENFVWMDSQDLRGVDKMLLRSVIVWLFGVQRQKNEVASTLASIPDHPKPTATEVMQLGKGQFYVCYGTTLKHTYVQPAGMEDAHAQAIARGEESPESWRQIEKALDGEQGSREAGTQEAEEESSPLRPGVAENSDSQIPDQRIGEEGQYSGAEDVNACDAAGIRTGDCEALHTGEIRLDESEDETVWKEKYEALSRDHVMLIEAHDALAERVRIFESRGTGHDPRATELRSPSGASPLPLRAGTDEGDGTGAAADSPGSAASVSVEELPLSLRGLAPDTLPSIYRYIIGRASREKNDLQLLLSRPELRVKLEREIIEADGKTLRGSLGILVSEKFFDQSCKFDVIRKELIRRGFLASKAPNRQILQALEGIVELGFLTREETGYQAVPGMKVHIIEMKEGKAVAAQ